MSNGMILPANLPLDGESAALSLTASNGNLPYIKLCGGSTNESDAKGGPIKTGNFAIIYSKTQLEEIGKGFDFIPVVARAKAFCWGEGMVSYKKDSALFQKIAGMAADSVLIGPEFLLWFPARKEFVAYHFNVARSKTAERAAGELSVLMMKFRKGECPGATVVSEIMENKKGQKWHGPTFSVCSSVLELPPQEELTDVVTKFISAKDSHELAAPAAAGTETRER